jgi:hypothetical protein
MSLAFALLAFVGFMPFSGCLLTPHASCGVELSATFSGLPPWWRTREGVGSGEGSYNKLGGVSSPADLSILGFLLGIVVMRREGSKSFAAVLFGFDAPGFSGCLLTPRAGGGVELSATFSGLPPWWRTREVVGSGEGSCNKLGGVSFPADLSIFGFLLGIVVMRREGSKSFSADLFGFDASGDLQAVISAMFFWSSSSAASFRPTAVSPSTKIAEGRLLRASPRRCFFNLQARVPKRRPSCFIMVCSVFLGPSGLVPGAEEDDHALKLRRIADGLGPDCNSPLQLRVLGAKCEDCVVISFLSVILLVICKTTVLC